ncbi:MAG: long-chain fatty acid--CoA ligase [Parvularculaceae bacterium]
MQGLMMDRPLLTTEILKHAVRNYRNTEIVTRTVEGPIHRYTFADSEKRIKKLANALVNLGVKQGDRIGVIGWNTHRQFELYYAIGGIGAVCHTINPRLGVENARYVINHAEDELLFFDTTFAPLVAELAPGLKTVNRYWALTDNEHAPDIGRPVEIYEELIAPESDAFDWPDFDENTAVALCYTSGTTGLPKGVLYSHRALVLQTLAASSASVLAYREGDAVLPVVPMFHVNAWNMPYSCPMIGCKLVFPGPGLDGESLCELFEKEKVTHALGVPTIWLGMLHYLEETGKTLPYLKSLLVGGAALSEALIRGFEKLGVEMIQGWGMTEMSPVGTVNTPGPDFHDLPDRERYDRQLMQGKGLPLVDMRIVDEEGNLLPHDGETAGRVQVRGAWVIGEYFGAESPTLTDDGWFDTGDVATIDKDGFLQITDRSKDVIKSGGEWVSSIDVENAALLHPAVAQAGVIGVPHPKWQERPLLIVVKKPGADVSAEDLKAFVSERLPKIAWPDAVEFVDALPLGATGKVLKTELRKMFKDYELPG